MKPTIARIVHVNIGTDAEPSWRPAMVTAVWPQEFGFHPIDQHGLNVTVFPDGENDRHLLERLQPPASFTGDCLLLHLTSVPHEGVPRAEGPAGGWVPTGPTWRWPPKEVS